MLAALWVRSGRGFIQLAQIHLAEDKPSEGSGRIAHPPFQTVTDGTFRAQPAVWPPGQTPLATPSLSFNRLDAGDADHLNQ